MGNDDDQNDRNVYAAPRAAVGNAASDAPAEFYVVSPGKFLWLYFGTYGIYQLYWCWKHWSLYRRRHGARILPAVRSLFALFFAHALNARIADALARDGVPHRWSPGRLAAAFVVVQLASLVLTALSWFDLGAPWVDLANLAMLLPTGLAMLGVQRAANAACGDPRGAGNARLDVANAAWLLLGALFWMTIVIGALLLLVRAPIEIDVPAASQATTRSASDARGACASVARFPLTAASRRCATSLPHH